MLENIKSLHSFKIFVSIGILSFFFVSHYNFVHAESYKTSVAASSSITNIINPTGALDYPEFGVKKIGVQSDGKVVATGWYLTGPGESASTSDIFRMNLDGGLDETYSRIKNYDFYKVFDLKMLSDNTSLLVGDFQTDATTSHKFISKDETGSEQEIAEFNGVPRAIDIDSKGKIYIVGNFLTTNGSTTKGIVRYNPDHSTRDEDFLVPNDGFTLASSTPSLSDISIDQSNALIIVGDFDEFNGQVITSKIIKLDSTGAQVDIGAFDPGTGFDVAPDFVQVRSDGKVMVAGEFTTYNDVPVPNLVRLNKNGSLDTTFDSGTGLSEEVLQSSDENFSYFGILKRVNKILFQDNEKMLLFGNYVNYDGNVSPGMTRINGDGSYDSTLDISIGFDLSVKDAVFFEPSEEVFVGGSFTQFNEKSTPYVGSLSLYNPQDVSTIEPLSGNVTNVAPHRRGSYRRDTLFKNPLFIAEAGASVAPVSSTPNLTSFKFADNMRDLQLNIVGDDVKLFQQFLNAKGFIINPVTGQPGSVGFETSFFGEKTRQALIKLQQKYNITPAVGYFGPKTKALVKSL